MSSPECLPEPPPRVATEAGDGGPLLPPLLERLAHVEGFELQVALHNLGGNQPLLERVLGRFVQTYQQGEPALAQTATPDPFRAWLAACHSLRGACATLGASLLPPMLRAFEQELHTSADVPALAATAGQVNAQLVRLVDRLALALVA